jgi:hypothetical protein
MARQKSALRGVIEPLEKRLLLSGINQNLGQLNGRFWTQGSVFDSNHSDEYHFTLAQAGSVDIQLSRMIGTGRMVLEQGKELPSTNFIASTKFSSNDQELNRSLAAGDYLLLVVADQSQLFPSAFYTLAIAPDYAPGKFFANSFDYRADQTRNLGTLSEESDNHVNDFIGFLDTNAHSAGDLIDTYSFNVPARGTVNAVVGGLTIPDQAGSLVNVSADLELFRDTNGDGRLQTSELIASDTTHGTGVAHTTPITLNPGKYFVVVSESGAGSAGSIGGSNYLLKFIYNAFDNAGNTLPGATSVSLNANPQTFKDYLSSLDTTDIYKFTTGAGGPFDFSASLTGVGASDFDLQLIEDKNHNNAIDISNGEIIGFSQNRGISDEQIDQLLTTADTYYLIVKRFFGEDAYTLKLSDRNTDVAGNTSATALNLGELDGQRTFRDSVSATDTDDFFQFTTPAFGVLKASFPATASGTDANMQLLSSSGAVILTSARAGNVGESIQTKAAAGTYFVRISRGAGSPNYSLTLSLDTAGPVPTNARVLGATASTGEFVGADDARDTFKIHLNSPQQLTITLSNLTAAVDLSVASDANQNDLFDPSEITHLQTVSSPGGTFSANLSSAGDFYVLIDAIGSASTNYTIALATAPPDFAGNTLAKAGFAGEAGKFIHAPFTDFVGSGSAPASDDPVDFYRLSVRDGGPYVLNAVMTQLSAAPNNAAFNLFRDDNQNGVIDSGEQVFGNTGPNLVKNITTVLDVPGEYYLQVLRLSGNVNYTLSIAATSLDGAGNFLLDAKDLGSLTTSLTGGDSVGPIDHDDFFKFSVAQAGEAAIHLSTPTDGSVVASIVQDINHSGDFDPGNETLGAVFHGTVLDGVVLPAAGNYFVHIIPTGGDVNYNFTLTFSRQTPFNGAPFQIDNASIAGTKIEAEDFDKGGQPDAYLDTTPGNDNGAFRSNTSVDVKTTADAGGGFRVTDTAVGEYLEYTIKMTRAGNYDFDFRVASPAAGASCHIEIDGANVTGAVAIPNTGGFDTMTTVTKVGIPVTAGAHVMRLSMDAGTATGFCGSFNFITIRPSQTPGAFAIAPIANVVAPNQDTKLALTWTVPSGSWHLLTDIRLRFVADDGTILAIRWNEAAKTLALWYPAANAYGPAMSIGSDHVLSNSYMRLNLADSSVSASGPTSPTVTLMLDLKFKQKLVGQTLVLRAAADDDLGKRGGFETGAVWRVNG